MTADVDRLRIELAEIRGHVCSIKRDYPSTAQAIENCTHRLEALLVSNFGKPVEAHCINCYTSLPRGGARGWLGGGNVGPLCEPCVRAAQDPQAFGMTMDPAVRIAELEQQNRQLLLMLTQLHRDTFAHQMTPHSSSVLEDASYMRLMGTMSQTRTLIQKLGGSL